MSKRPIPEFSAPRRVLLAAPRGYCAGVDRAVDIVEVALQTYGAPIYVRKQIVHNLHVVRRLEAKGAIFVDELDEVPAGATVVFSAHGVAPEVHQQARARDLKVVDATCPLVTKVHQEARKFAGKGYDIVLIGHEGHEEVIGTMGEAPRAIHLVGNEREAAAVKIADPDKVAYLTQTTLSVDETQSVIGVLRDPPDPRGLGRRSGLVRGRRKRRRHLRGVGSRMARGRAGRGAPPARRRRGPRGPGRARGRPLLASPGAPARRRRRR